MKLHDLHWAGFQTSLNEGVPARLESNRRQHSKLHASSTACQWHDPHPHTPTAANSTPCQCPYTCCSSGCPGMAGLVISHQGEHLALTLVLYSRSKAGNTLLVSTISPPSTTYLAGKVCRLLFARCKIRRLGCPTKTGMHWSVRLLLVK